ncbi:MAG: CPBP family intramembrane metalloprotease [Firmicutes bacterium]|jgi:membrane protease YdiL (CAAX protease family)|nr:CPBP family intramembrane metalloprotease [Bacillota bacterium]
MAKTLKSLCWTLLLTVILLGIPKIAGAIASTFDYRAIDPDGAFAWLAVHHLAQAAIFSAIMVGIRKIRPLDFGLIWGNKKVGRQYVLRFILIFSVFMIGSMVITHLTNSFQPFSHPLTARNIVGYLGFQLFLTGPSEELIFRAFAITLLGLVLKGRGFSGKASLANIASAVIFGLAHVNFSLAPFQVSYAPIQVILAVVLGLFYGDCYEKSGSVFYPMIMHSIGNVLSVSATIVTTMVQ